MAFRRVICGIDGSPEALSAARSAVRLVSARGTLVLVAVVDPWRVILDLQGREPQEVLAERAARAGASLDDVAAALPADVAVERRVIEGRPGPALLEEIARQEGDLVVLGSHGQSRGEGILIGSVASLAAHDAPCPVLIARAPDPASFPAAVTVGVDGSEGGWEAWRLAADIGRQCGAAVRAVIAADEDEASAAAVRERLPQVVVVPGSAAGVLTESVTSPDELLVLGARGATGLASLGSVSERVAHRARCSVLVVRPLQPYGP